MSSSTYSTKNKKGRFMGVAISVLLHLLVFVLCFRMFLSSAVELPMSVIEVSIEPEPVKIIKPKQIEIKPPITGKKEKNVPPVPTKAAEIDNRNEEVEVPVEKPVPVEIDQRSLFHSQDVGETEDNASGNNPVSQTSFAGDSDPNADASDEVPTFDLRNRDVIGKLEQPANTSNRDGRVVVEITVNQKGEVIEARARTRGTTIQNVVLWNAAEEAARKTLFNTDLKSPALQKGTITYVFKLK